MLARSLSESWQQQLTCWRNLKGPLLNFCLGLQQTLETPLITFSLFCKLVEVANPLVSVANPFHLHTQKLTSNRNHVNCLHSESKENLTDFKQNCCCMTLLLQDGDLTAAQILQFISDTTLWLQGSDDTVHQSDTSVKITNCVLHSEDSVTFVCKAPSGSTEASLAKLVK